MLKNQITILIVVGVIIAIVIVVIIYFSTKNKDTYQNTLSNNIDYDVIVIGAGISGIRCAQVLINNGYKVCILEGNNRIGGRLHRVKFCDDSAKYNGYVHGAYLEGEATAFAIMSGI